MTDFNERLNRIAESRGITPTPDPVVTKQLPKLTASDPNQPPFLLIPLAIIIGAFAVLAGRVFQLVVMGDGLQESVLIPPQLGVAGIAVALVLCGIYERLCRGSNEIRGAVTIGFLAMAFGEGLLADTFPGLWTDIYQADYLEFALGEVGDPGVTLQSELEYAATPVALEQSEDK